MAHTDEPRAIAPALYAFPQSGGGTSFGFVTVAIGYLLGQHGFAVAAVAGIVSFRLLPNIWRFVFGPIVDMSLSPRRWCMIGIALNTAAILAFVFLPMTAAMLPAFGICALASGLGENLAGTALAAAIGITAAPSVRGRIAGWQQAGYLGGTGIGGGLGLWLATHVGPVSAGIVLAGWMLAAAWPLLRLRAPRPDHGQPVARVTRDLLAELLRLARTRAGVLAIIAVTVPMGLGAFISLSAPVAGDWHASADMVAAVTGVLAGLASIPGCLFGGYLSDRIGGGAALAIGGFVCALSEVAMALGPHTPVAFAVFILLYNLLNGVAYAAVNAVVLGALEGVGAGTVASLLGSLANVPLIIVTMVLGYVQARGGSTAMLMTEAGLGLASAPAYALLAYLWKASSSAPLPEASAA